MKKFSKIVSFMLAAMMVTSAFSINAFAAASKAHTLTLAADKDSYEAGENVKLTITIDNTADLAALSYLVRVSEGLTVETAKVAKLEKFIDKTWLDDMKKDDNSVGDYWKYYMGEPTISYAEANTFKVVWAGGANGGMGNEDPDNEVKDNRVVGVFNIKINDDAADGKYTIALDDSVGTTFTADAGQGVTPTLLTADALTIQVGEDAPAKEDVVIDDVNDFDYTDVYVEDGVEKKHAAFEVAFTVAENNNPVTALNVTGTKTAKVALKTAVTSGTCNVFINVLGVPADATLGTITVAPVAE